MKQNVGKAVKIAVLTVGAFVMIFPFLWMLFTSLKTLPESISIPPTLFPAVPQFENYTEALAVAPLAFICATPLLWRAAVPSLPWCLPCCLPTALPFTNFGAKSCCFCFACPP